MLCPSHPPWLDHSNYTWRRLEVMIVKTRTQFTDSSPPRTIAWRSKNHRSSFNTISHRHFLLA
jgi:hypothetical protein